MRATTDFSKFVSVAVAYQLLITYPFRFKIELLGCAMCPTVLKFGGPFPRLLLLMYDLFLFPPPENENIVVA